MKAFINTLILLLFAQYIFAQRANETPQALYKQANIFYQNHQYRPALEYTNMAVAQDKDYIEGYLLRAKIKEKMDDILGAITDYSITIFIDPSLSDARFNRAQLYFHQNRCEDALEDFHVLLKQPAGETATVYFKGKDDITGFSATGITTLQSNMKAEIFNYLGLTHLKLNHLDSAEYYLNEALLTDPNEADYYVNKGLLMEANSDTLNAIKAYQQALSHHIDHAVALSNLSKLTKKSQYKQLVNESYDLAVSEQATYQSFFNRGVMRQSQNMHRKAIQDFNQAIRVGSTNAEVLLMRAYSKESIMDYDGALEDYSDALKFNPTLIKAYINRGNTYYKIKKYTEAVNDFNVALQMDSTQAKIYFNRGLANYLSGNPQLACKDLNKALEMNFYSAEAPIEAYCLTPPNN
ncbi:tetratricopeptide repeat protein [Catalinimonas sp. 4WD22]|uniref:tetratricopeptide repeat protein n=1 Tax=Catalinimonas locisalis TaxID=3133978 RepID=UPI003100B5E8